MSTEAMIERITSRLPLLPPSVVQALYEIAVHVPTSEDSISPGQLGTGETLSLFLQSFGQEWDTPEENAAWANL